MGRHDLSSLRLVTSFLQASVFLSAKASQVGWESQGDLLLSQKELSTSKAAGLQD